MTADKDHTLLAQWAAECAEHVLFCFEDHYPDDDRPRKAIEASRAWACGVLTVAEAREAAFAAHVAARSVKDEAAIAAARSAGHAAATAHVAAHARYAGEYAVKAVAAAHDDVDTESDWQYQRLPSHLRTEVFPEVSDED